jgi:molybdopterin molybdotransferase
VLTTGNELVAPELKPGPGQIRNSNGPMLAACLAEMKVQPTVLGIGRDDRDELRRLIETGLQADVLLISGGVSAGVYDLVPGVLAELSVRQVFHKIRLKPGKPLWFGVLERAAGACLVFGLPGNPMSSYVCCQLFVRPALARLAAWRDVDLRRSQARLGSTQQVRGERANYMPAVVEQIDRQWVVTEVAWRGSGDLAGLSRANALACFPVGDRTYAAGEEIEIYWLD